MRRQEAREWVAAAGAGQEAPGRAGGCGAEPAVPPPGCAAMGGQVTRSLLYGKDQPAGPSPLRGAAGKGEEGATGGMRTRPGLSPRSILVPEGEPGVGL